MAKILKPGRDEPGWTIEVRCRGTTTWRRESGGCGALISFEKADLYFRHEHDIGGSRDIVVGICPACKTAIDIDEPFGPGELPPLPKQQA